MKRMEAKEKIQEMVQKILSDKTILEQFKADPVKAVEQLTGADFPDDAVNAVISGVKAKIGLESAGDLLGGIKKLF